MSTPERQAEVALAAIGRALAKLRAFTSGVDEEAFHANEQLRDAVALNLLIIGENVKRLTPEMKSRISTVPWEDVIALRNRIAHGYDTISFSRLWAILMEDLAVMEAAAEELGRAISRDLPEAESS